MDVTAVNLWVVGLLEYACVATCDMKERIKGAGKKHKKYWKSK